jgi:hypothetical protein
MPQGKFGQVWGFFQYFWEYSCCTFGYFLEAFMFILGRKTVGSLLHYLRDFCIVLLFYLMQNSSLCFGRKA